MGCALAAKQMSFFRNILILTIVVGAVLAALVYFTGYELVHPLAYVIVTFFALITLGAYYAIQKGSKNDPGSFQLYFMGSSVLRVLLCMTAVFIYVFLASERELQFALNFFAIYFIYTGFEIYGILSNLRRISKK
jgi:hypothetical protein